MERNDKNNRLLIRTLGKTRGREPDDDFTCRVMARIEREDTRGQKRENRLLLTGAVLCSLGLILLGVVVSRLSLTAYPDAFAQIGTSIGQIASSVDTWFSPAVSDEKNAFVWLWTYVAVVFLVFVIIRQLLRQRRFWRQAMRSGSSD